MSEVPGLPRRATAEALGTFAPARSFAPALVSGQWRDFWVYLAGPLLGAPLGAFAYQFVRGERRAGAAHSQRPSG